MKALEDSLKLQGDLDYNDNDHGGCYFANTDIASQSLEARRCIILLTNL